MIGETSTANLQLSSATINRSDSHLIDILRNQNISQQNVILNYRRELLDIRQFSATERTLLEEQINELNQRVQELEKNAKEVDENVSHFPF
jgi:hypothetical protein